MQFHRFWYSCIFLVVILLHILIFPRGTDQEYLYERRWETELSPKVHSDAVDVQDAIPFVSNNHYGFFADNGMLYHYQQQGYGIAWNKQYYIPYNKVSLLSVIYRKDGRQEGIIPASGYPFFIQNNLYLLGENARLISEWKTDGSPLWEQHSSSPITAVIPSNIQNKSIFATLFGAVITSDATVLLEPNGYPVYALAISGTNLFLIRGGVEQSAILYDIEFSSEGEKLLLNPRASHVLNASLHKTVPAFFMGNEIFFSTGKGIMSMDTRGQVYEIVSKRAVIHLATDEGLIFSLEEDGQGRRFLDAWSAQQQQLFSVELPENCDFFYAEGGILYLANGDALISIALFDA